MDTIAVTACLDTKYHEVSFVAQQLKRMGVKPLVMDISTAGTVPIEADIPREAILAASGISWESSRGYSKEELINRMSGGLAVMLLELYKGGKIQGVLGMGGLQNTVMCKNAMQALPLGFPKLIVSTVASGYRYFDTVVGDSDITVMPSIVDFAGMNPVAEAILSNACAAMAGMVRSGGGIVDGRKHTMIGTTLMGITNDTVMRAADLLTAAGWQTISFHSTGAGGKAMEKMIRDGMVTASLDLTLHEMTSEFFGGYGYSRGADNRLCAGAQMGIPMVVCPGGIDFICLRPDELFPDQEKRGYTWHNSGLTHTRLYEEEILSICHTIAERLNRSEGEVTVLLPMGGLRTMSRKGEPFYIPGTIGKMRKLFEDELKPQITLKCCDLNFDDREFGKVAADEMLRLLEQHGRNE